MSDHASTPAAPHTRAELTSWITDWMTRELDLRGATVTPDRPFVAYGMDSIHAMMLVGDLEELLGRRLTPTLTWDHPTVDALAAYLAPSAVPSPAAPSADTAPVAADEVNALLLGDARHPEAARG